MPSPVTVITGASAGIGLELARVFAQCGHSLVLIARREQRLLTLAAELTEAGYVPPIVLPLDLTQPQVGARIRAELRGRGLAARYIVNNAGFGLVGLCCELNIQDQLQMLDVNVRALTDLSLAFTDDLERLRGGILNVASVAGFLPGPRSALYYASKAFVLSLSEALHYELRDRGITVTALCPGPVQTEFQSRSGVRRPFGRSLLNTDARTVAEQGFRGLMRGQRLVVPGIANRVLTCLPRVLPYTVLAFFTDRRQRRRMGT